MPQPGSALNMIMGLEMSEPAGPQRPICHPSCSLAFPSSYLFPCCCAWLSARGPFALLGSGAPRGRRFSGWRAALPCCARCCAGPRGAGLCAPRAAGRTGGVSPCHHHSR